MGKNIEYRKVTVDEFSQLPIKVVVERSLKGTPQQFFSCFSSAKAWRRWAKLNVTWTSSEPFDKNTTRTVNAAGTNKTVHEQFLVWDKFSRIAFRLDSGNVGFINALVEDYRVQAIDAETMQFTWIAHLEARGFFKILTPVLRLAANLAFKRLANQLVDYMAKNHQNY